MTGTWIRYESTNRAERWHARDGSTPVCRHLARIRKWTSRIREERANYPADSNLPICTTCSQHMGFAFPKGLRKRLERRGWGRITSAYNGLDQRRADARTYWSEFGRYLTIRLGSVHKRLPKENSFWTLRMLTQIDAHSADLLLWEVSGGDEKWHDVKRDGQALMNQIDRMAERLTRTE